VIIKWTELESID